MKYKIKDFVVQQSGLSFSAYGHYRKKDDTIGEFSFDDMPVGNSSKNCPLEVSDVFNMLLLAIRWAGKEKDIIDARVNICLLYNYSYKYHLCTFWYDKAEGLIPSVHYIIEEALKENSIKERE